MLFTIDFGQQRACGILGGIDNCVDRRIQQIVPDDEKIRISGGVWAVPEPHVEQPLTPGTRVDGSDPAVHLAFHEQLLVLCHRSGQGRQSQCDQPLIVEIRHCERVVPGKQPTQNPVGAMRVAGALVIKTASSKRIEHEIGALHLASPERSLEKTTDAKVVGGKIVVRDMLLEALAQDRVVPLDLAQPILWQCQHHDVKFIADKSMLPPRRDAIGSARSAAYSNDRRVEPDLGCGLRCQAIDQPLDSPLYGIQAYVALIIHQNVLQTVESRGQIRFCRDVAAGRNRHIFSCSRVPDFVEYLGKQAIGPWMLLIELASLPGNTRSANKAERMTDRNWRPPPPPFFRNAA